MQRLLIALLAAFDAFIAAAVGIAVVLAALTLLWVFGGGSADWGALWPAAAAVWQLGHLVPITVHLSADYLAAARVPAAAASITVSLAPLAFAAFTAWCGARSGARAGVTGAWPTGVASGTIAFGAVAAAVWATSRGRIVEAAGWQAVLLPVLVFAVPAVAGAVWTAWRDDAGLRRVHDLIDDLPGEWPEAPGLALRGALTALVALIGLGALAVLAATVLRGDQVVALYQAGNLDTVGVVVVSLGQLAYLPVLIVWGLAFVAGPGFALGAGTAVSPAGTQLGVLPGIPALGLVPDSSSVWLLALALLPVGTGVLAGLVARSGVSSRAGYGVRAGVTAGIGVLAAAGAALLAWLAGGAIGPDRLAQAGPEPAALALAVGLEVLLGAGIVLLGPAPRSAAADPADPGRGADAAPHPAVASAPTQAGTADGAETVPIDPGWP